MIRCPAGHWFTGPLESLTLTTEPGRAAALPAITQPGAAAPARPRAAPDAGGGKDANNEMARRARRWLRGVRGWRPDRNPPRRRCEAAVTDCRRRFPGGLGEMQPARAR
jgi:hypothetical protein